LTSEAKEQVQEIFDEMDEKRKGQSMYGVSGFESGNSPEIVDKFLQHYAKKVKRL
jgi:hypothetical protein